MMSIQEVAQVPVTHVGQSHPAKTFNGSRPLNVFAKQPILMYEKVPDVRGIARYLKRDPTNTLHAMKDPTASTFI